MKLYEIIEPLKILDSYQSIAWDFDKTLIDNPHSPLFHKYILQTPEKRHIIVTFRSGGLVESMFDEFEDYPDAPTFDDFDGYINIDSRAWSSWSRDEFDRRTGRLTGPLTEPEEYYVNWKGATCKKNRLPILIDDDIGNTQPGCKKHGIVLLNSLTLSVV
jgi:hypothetical protein